MPRNNRSTVQIGLFNAFGLIGLQALIVVFIALAWGAGNFHAMPSVLLGGTVYVLPNGYFALRFFMSGRNNKPKRVVYAFYIGEVLKLLMMVGMSLIIFTAFQVKILPFMVGFIGATVGLWATPLFVKNDVRAG